MFLKLRATLIILFTFFVSMTAFAGTNPFLATADATVVCATDNSTLATFALCGAGDTRTFQVTDPDVQSIAWEVLDTSSCGAATQDCPNLNGTCSWNTVATSSSFSLNTEGEYRVILTLVNGISELFYAKSSIKTYSDAIVITQLISSNGGSNGELVVSVTGDSDPYIYQLQKDGAPGGPFQNSPIFDNLSAGSYMVLTLDSSGVCEYYSSEIILIEPEPLVASLTQTQVPSCIAGGTVVVSATGGVAPYQYSLNGGAYVSSNVFTNLTAGSYSAEVIDANTIQSTTNGILITSAPPLSITNTVQNVTCSGMEDGSIEIEAFGGTGSYQYQLMNATGNLGAPQLSPLFQNLAPGVYDVMVTDSGNCTSYTSPIFIQEPTAIDVVVTTQAISGNGSNDGVATITATGGAQQYQYAISPNLNEFYTSNVFTNLSPGTYTVLTQDQSGCVSVVSFNLEEPSALAATLSQNNTCAGNGEIEVSASGGLLPYQYSINGGAFNASNVFSGLSAGFYTVQVRDANNTLVENSITIPPTTPIVVNYSSQDVLCNGEGNALVLVEPAGGTGIYEYQIHQNGFSSAFQSNDSFEGLEPGSYVVSVRDSSGCIADSDTFEVFEPEPFVLTYTSTSPSDANASDGSLTLNANGGSGGYGYSIDGGQTIMDSNTFENLTTGQYEVLAVDGNFCYAELGIIDLTVASQISLNATVQNQITCTSNARVLLIPSGGVPPYEFSTGTSSFRTTNPFGIGTPGDYIFTVRDANGATATSSAVTITSSQTVRANIQTLQGSCNLDEQQTVIINLTQGTGIMEYSLYDGIWQDSNTFNDVAAGNYNAFVRNTECTFGLAIEVKQTVRMTASVVETADDSVRFSITGGLPPYSYAIGERRNYQDIGNATEYVVSDLTPGSYFIFVENSGPGGCEEILSFDIEGFIPELEIVSVVSNSSCFGATDGSISVTGVGGLGDYNYGLVDGDNNIIYNVRPEITHFEGLAPGTYKALLRDTRLGRLVRSELITITEPEVLSVTFLTTIGTPINANNGVANLQVAGGTAPYEYSIDGNTAYSPLIDSKISDLYLGDHVAMIRDSNGCETDVSFVIENLVDKDTQNVIIIQNSGSTEVLDVSFVESQESETTVIIYNIYGSLLFSVELEKGTSETQLNVATLARGIYFIYIKNDAIEEVKKVMIL